MGNYAHNPTRSGWAPYLFRLNKLAYLQSRVGAVQAVKDRIYDGVRGHYRIAIRVSLGYKITFKD